MPSLAAFLSVLLLCAVPVQARRCYYLDYPPTHPGNDLRGPTHTCTCRSNGRWGNCRRNSDMTRSSSDDVGTIVDVAVANNFDTLVTAVKAADLAGALSSDGPFTVFAPTDAAFAALPDGVLDQLLDDTEALASVLLYHVVAGKVEADDVPRYLKAETLGGEDIELRNNGRKVTVNRVDVIAADVKASNGVIHVIDEVLIPPSLSLASSSEDSGPGTIVDVAVENNFNTLVAAVQAAGLVDALSGEGPLTVFAPTDAAFAALPEGIVDALLADTDTLTKVLLYHVVEGNVKARDIPRNLMAETLEGTDVELRNLGGSVTVNRRADVVLANVAASNGVVHVIDRVLIPDDVFDAVFSTCPR